MDELLSELELRRIQLKLAKRAIQTGDYDGYFEQQTVRVKLRIKEIMEKLNGITIRLRSGLQ